MGLFLKIKTASNLQTLWKGWQSLTYPRESVNCFSVKRSTRGLLGWHYTVSQQHLQHQRESFSEGKRLKDNSFESKNKDSGYQLRCCFPTALLLLSSRSSFSSRRKKLWSLSARSQHTLPSLSADFFCRVWSYSGVRAHNFCWVQKELRLNRNTVWPTAAWDCWAPLGVLGGDGMSVLGWQTRTCVFYFLEG